MIGRLVVQRHPVAPMLAHPRCTTRGRTLTLGMGLKAPELFGVVDMKVDQPCADHLYARRGKIPNAFYLGMTIPMTRRPLKIEAGGRRLDIPSGSYSLGNPKEVHDMLPGQAFRVLVLVWGQPLLREWRDRAGIPRGAGGFDFSADPRPLTSEMREELDRFQVRLGRKDTETPDPWSALDVYASALRLFGAVWRETPSGLRERLRSFGFPRPVDPRVDRVVEHMREHVADPLSIPRLAKVGGVSAPNMYKLFDRQFGCSPRHLLNRIRVEEADRLRKNHPNLELWEIARRVGYERWDSLVRARKALGRPRPRG